MLSQNNFDDLIKQLMELGYSRETAEDYAVRIGDTIEEDENGLVVIRDDDGKVLDRLALRFEE